MDVLACGLILSLTIHPICWYVDGLLFISEVGDNEEAFGNIFLFKDEYVIVGEGSHITLAQGRMVVIEADELLVFLVDLWLGRPVYGNELEEIDRLGVAYLLRTVDEGSAMGEDGGYIGSHRTTVVGELLAGCGLGGVVVVSGETHLDFACRQTIVLGLISLDEVRNGSPFHTFTSSSL